MCPGFSCTCVFTFHVLLVLVHVRNMSRNTVVCQVGCLVGMSWMFLGKIELSLFAIVSSSPFLVMIKISPMYLLYTMQLAKTSAKLYS